MKSMKKIKQSEGLKSNHGVPKRWQSSNFYQVAVMPLRGADT
jgi:hypothetical protein